MWFLPNSLYVGCPFAARVAEKSTRLAEGQIVSEIINRKETGIV